MERLATGILTLLAISIIIGVVLGPLGFGTVQFHMNRNSIVQYQGSEVVMLGVAVGLLISAWMSRSNRDLGASISLGLALFVIYTMVTVVMGQEYGQFPGGNSEKFFLLYTVITSLATVAIVLSLSALSDKTLHVSPGWTKMTKWTLAIQAGLFALMWLGQITNVYRNGFTTELAETRLLFWLVKYLDLGFLIPGVFITIALLQYRQPLAGVLILGLSGFITVMLIAIGAMTISSWVQNEPEGVLVLAAGMFVLALPSALVWWQWASVVSTE